MNGSGGIANSQVLTLSFWQNREQAAFPTFSEGIHEMTFDSHMKIAKD